MATTALTTTAAAPDDKAETLKKFLERHQQAIVSAAANGISPQRVLKIALLAATKAPLLSHEKMDKMSVLQSIVQAASLGLEAGSALGEAYLVPFWNTRGGKYECQLIIGYRGLISLARRSGSILSVDARPVFEGEQFEVDFGTDPKIVHRPNFDSDADRTEKSLRAVYAVWKIDGGGTQFAVMSRAEVTAIRARSKAGDNGPWVSDFIAMALKSVLRSSVKLVPMSVEMADALEEDARREFGDFDVHNLVAPNGSQASSARGVNGLKERLGVGAPATAETSAPAPDQALLDRVQALRSRAELGEVLADEEAEELRNYKIDHPELFAESAS